MAERDDKKSSAPRGDKQRFGGSKKFGGKRPDGGGFKPRLGKHERQAQKEGHPISPNGETAQRSRPPVGEMSAKRTEGGAVPPAHKRKGGRPGISPRGDRPAIVRPGDEIAAASERIAKRLARGGIASRRDAEALVADGRVKVNGSVLTSPAFNVGPTDRIEVDGAEIPPIERTRLFLFHKPAGVVTTNRDPEGRRTVFDVLPKDLPRLMTVGRLDINTEGLLLLTNDGGLARLLELPATGWLRRYRVRVHGKVEPEALASLKDGIAVDGVFYGSIEASLDREQGSNAWLTIGLREGKNREVKNILGALGLEVSRLIRISYGPFQLGELPEGAVQELKGRTLRDQLGERLIEEAGANFEAPIAKPFSNKPVEGRGEERPQRPKIVRDGIQGRIGEGGLIKRSKRDRQEERTAALSRLATKPDRGKFARDGERRTGGKPLGKDEARSEPARPRTSNVWMAPGARPQGKKTPAASTPPSPRPARGEGKGEGQRGDRKFGEKRGFAGNKPAFGGKPKFGGAKKGASSAPRASSPRDRGDGKGGGPGKGRGSGADRRR
jgi:23S rRNA pseudouridine2605 synthase